MDQNNYGNTPYGGQPGNRQEDNGQQPGYGAQYYGGTPRPKKDGSSLGIASLAFGVLALILFCTCLNIPLAIVSIVLGTIQIAGYKEKILATIGIVLSAASLILMIIAFLVFFNLSLDVGNITNDPASYEEYFEQYFNNLEDGSF